MDATRLDRKEGTSGGVSARDLHSGEEEKKPGGWQCVREPRDATDMHSSGLAARLRRAAVAIMRAVTQFSCRRAAYITRLSLRWSHVTSTCVQREREASRG